MELYNYCLSKINQLHPFEHYLCEVDWDLRLSTWRRQNAFLSCTGNVPEEFLLTAADTWLLSAMSMGTTVTFCHVELSSLCTCNNQKNKERKSEEDTNSNLMFKLDLHVIRCRHTHIFLCSKVWFVPRLNDEEILFHILILERRVRIGQCRSECRESKLSLMKHLKLSRRDIFDNLRNTTKQKAI